MQAKNRKKTIDTNTDTLIQNTGHELVQVLAIIKHESH